MAKTGIAIAPFADEGLLDAVSAGGGEVVEPAAARGLVWTNPADPQALQETIDGSLIEWVQLPLAGIEFFVEAGVIDPARTWTCAKGTYGHACAEHALALMLTAARRIHYHARNRRWEPSGPGRPESRLKDKVVVIYGTGGIGGALVPMLTPLGARMVGVNRSGRPLDGAEKTVTLDRLAEIAAVADFLVVAAAVTPETISSVDDKVLAALPEHAWIVYVARGSLVDTEALVRALNQKSIAGAALDVTEPEPLPEDHPLWASENTIITPHIANTWDMALPDLTELVRRNVANFVGEKPLEGLVDVEAGY